MGKPSKYFRRVVSGSRPWVRLTRRFKNRLPLLLASLLALGCFGNAATSQANATNSRKPLVTFVELGSVNCVPCRMMKPVMEAVEKAYGWKVKVVFHDVWTPEGKKYGQDYRIRAIPTQVFLDAEGKEFFRHEGFFSKEEIDKVLAPRMK